VNKNLIQSLGSWAQNVVVVRSVQVKSCSVMEMPLMVSLCTGMFRLFSDQLVFKQFIFKTTSILSVSFVLSGCGNYAQRVKYLGRVDVNISCRTTVRSKERYYQVRKSRDRERSRIMNGKFSSP